MANIPEALAVKRLGCVKRMLEKLARGESGTRWELTDWGPRTHSDENFMLGVVRRLAGRGLVVKPSVYRAGGPGGSVPPLLSPAPGATFDTSDDTVTALCWPGLVVAPQPEMTDEQLAEMEASSPRAVEEGADEPEYEPGEPQAPDKVDLLLRVVGQLAENVVYMREKLDGQKPSTAPEVDAVLELLGGIETKLSSTPMIASTKLGAIEHRLITIESRLTSVDASKLEDTVKVVNAVATSANQQSENVVNALGALNQRLGAIEQAVGALLKRPTAHVQVQPDPDIAQILKKANAISNQQASFVNSIAEMRAVFGQNIGELQKAEKTWEKSIDIWQSAATKWNELTAILVNVVQDYQRVTDYLDKVQQAATKLATEKPANRATK